MKKTLLELLSKMNTLPFELTIFMSIFLWRLRQKKKLYVVINGLKRYKEILTIIVGFSIYTHFYPNPSIIEALKKAILAFIIAYFADFGLVAATFYLVGILSYYSRNWV